MTVETAAAIRAVLTQEMERDERLVLLGEAVGRSGGEAGTTAGLLARFGGDRVVDLPISDRATVALGSGMARAGARVIVELSSSTRLLPVVEVLADAARVAAAGDLPVPLVLRVPCGASRPVDLGDLLGSVEGLRVVCPSGPATARALLLSSLLTREPVVFLEPRDLYQVAGPLDVDEADLGSARVIRAGTDVTLAAWGTAVSVAMRAAAHLDRSGVSAGVLDLVSLVPIDRSTLGAQLRQTGRLVVVDAAEIGGAHRALQAGLAEAFLHLEAPMAVAPADLDAVVDTATRAARY